MAGHIIVPRQTAWEKLKNTSPQVKAALIGVAGTAVIGLATWIIGGARGSTVVNVTYVAPNSPTAQPIRAELEEKRNALKAELIERYPYGFTMIGIRGAQFTTLDHENGLFRVDTNQASIHIDRKNQTVNYEARIVKAKDAPETRMFDAATLAGFRPLNETNRLNRPFTLAGVSIFVELVSTNNDEKVLVVGFRPADPAIDLDALTRDWLQRERQKK